MQRGNTASEILEAIKYSGQHYKDSIPLIASENILSPLVREACNSDLHGRYAEGLPGKRYYQGCEDFDTIEEIGIKLAKRVFDCNFANIQSTSGTNSNLGVLKALTKPGQTITAVSTADGGHISHARMGAVGMRGLDLITYPWNEERMEPDIDAAAKLIREVKPNLALFGQSVFLFPTPLKDLSDDLKFIKRLNNGIFPGVCSSYHLHHVAGKAIALSEFEKFGEDYAKDIVSNAKALAQALAEEGFDVLAEERGYTASHQVLTRHGQIDSGAGKEAASILEKSGIITNMNMLPGDTKAMSPSGLRLGTPELTRVGMGVDEMKDVAKFFSRALLTKEDPKIIKHDVKEFKSNFQTVHYCFEPGSAYPGL